MRPFIWGGFIVVVLAIAIFTMSLMSDPMVVEAPLPPSTEPILWWDGSVLG